jgi:DNA-binding XRE family transcriptional regulator
MENPEYTRLWEASQSARELAWKIIKYRMAHNLTQDQLARMAGLHPMHVDYLESAFYALPTAMKRILEVIDGERNEDSR